MANPTNGVRPQSSLVTKTFLIPSSPFGRGLLCCGSAVQSKNDLDPVFWPSNASEALKMISLAFEDKKMIRLPFEPLVGSAVCDKS